MPRTITRRKTTTLTNGTKVVRTSQATAPDLEWRLQAAAVRRLRQHSAYCPQMPDGGDLLIASVSGASVAQLPTTGHLWPAFTLAGDFNAARRSRQEATKAKATGLTSGEPDMRIYAAQGRLLLIELKAENGKPSDGQIDRHALLIGLGYMVVTIHATSEDECADLVEATVEEWLAHGRAANDNQPCAMAG